LGGFFQQTVVIEKRRSDTQTELKSSMTAEYSGVAIAGAASLRADHSSNLKIGGRNAKTTITVRGGQSNLWLGMDGTNMNKIQNKWSETVTREKMVPVGMELKPLWELLKQHPKKADELKKYMLDVWAKSSASIPQKNYYQPEQYFSDASIIALMNNQAYCKDLWSWVYCNTKYPETDERFTILHIKDNDYALKGGKHHRYCGTSGDGKVSCNLRHRGGEAIFTLESKDDGNKIKMKNGGKYCSVEDSTMYCKKEKYNQHNTFRVEVLEQGPIPAATYCTVSLANGDEWKAEFGPGRYDERRARPKGFRRNEATHLVVGSGCQVKVYDGDWLDYYHSNNHHTYTTGDYSDLGHWSQRISSLVVKYVGDVLIFPVITKYPEYYLT